MRLNGVQRLLETGLIVSTFAAIFILCALMSFDPADPSWSQTGEFLRVKNITGSSGAWVADILLFSFGWLAFFIPVAIQGFGYLLFKKPNLIGQKLTFYRLLTAGAKNQKTSQERQDSGYSEDREVLPFFEKIIL